MVKFTTNETKTLMQLLKFTNPPITARWQASTLNLWGNSIKNIPIIKR
jgi:hypothetical protein